MGRQRAFSQIVRCGFTTMSPLRQAVPDLLALFHLDRVFNIRVLVMKFNYRAGIAVALLALAGCSKDSTEQRYAVTGQVSYQGKPVPQGEVAFEPDATKGETGRASLSPITNGKYEIPAKYGVRPAAYVMRVTGYSQGESSGASQVDGGFEELFPLFTQEVTFPDKNMTLDIEIPEATSK